MMQQTADPLTTRAGREPGKPSKSVSLIRANPRWPDIQRDIIMGALTADKICSKYDIRREDGTLAITTVLRYRAWLRETYASLFAVADELEAKSIRGEFMRQINDVVEKASAGHDKAMNLKSRKTIGKGKNAEVVEVEDPNFAAANEFLGTMLGASSKLGEIIHVGTQAPVQVTQDNRQIVLMGLPKQPGVQSRPAAKQIIEGKTA